MEEKLVIMLFGILGLSFLGLVQEVHADEFFLDWFFGVGGSNTLNIVQGDTVHFVWTDGNLHTVQPLVPDASFGWVETPSSPTTIPFTASFTFTKTGVFEYQDGVFGPSMGGTIIVSPNDSDGDGVLDDIDSNPNAFTAINDGEWFDPNTWEGGIVPSTTDDKEIRAGVFVSNQLGNAITNSATLRIYGFLSGLYIDGTNNIENSGTIIIENTGNVELGPVINTGAITNHGFFNSFLGTFFYGVINTGGIISNFDSAFFDSYDNTGGEINNYCGASFGGGIDDGFGSDSTVGNPVNEILCVPNLVLPNDGSTVTEPKPDLIWENDAETRLVSYSPFLQDTSNPGIPIELVSLSLVSAEPLNILPDGNYNWDVTVNLDVNPFSYPAVAVPVTSSQFSFEALTVILDSDGDGIPDVDDQCPGQDDTIDVDTDGIPDCLDPLIDSDNDGVADSLDACPGFDDSFDSDGDGIPDGCESDGPTISCGAGTILQGNECVVEPQTDSDFDGTPDIFDQCPNDPNKIVPGFTGCGNAEPTLISCAPGTTLNTTTNQCEADPVEIISCGTGTILQDNECVVDPSTPTDGNVITENTTFNLKIQNGETWTITNGVTFTGNIKVIDGTLILEDNCTVFGNINSEGNNPVSINSCTVTGNVKVDGGTLDIVNSTVKGNVNAKNANGVTIVDNPQTFEKNLRVEDSTDVTITGNSVTENLRVKTSTNVIIMDNSANNLNVLTNSNVELNQNILQNNLQVNGNDLVEIVDNQAGKNLNVKNNSQCTHSGNTADGKIKIKDCTEITP